MFLRMRRPDVRQERRSPWGFGVLRQESPDRNVRRDASGTMEGHQRRRQRPVLVSCGGAPNDHEGLGKNAGAEDLIDCRSVREAGLAGRRLHVGHCSVDANPRRRWRGGLVGRARCLDRLLSRSHQRRGQQQLTSNEHPTNSPKHCTTTRNARHGTSNLESDQRPPPPTGRAEVGCRRMIVGGIVSAGFDAGFCVRVGSSG